MSPPVEAKKALDCEVVLTSSGAPAMLDRVTGEVMHPVVGPMIEAERLYVGPSRLAERLARAGASPLVLFDVGLGAGSNAAAALRLALASPANGRRLAITSFDRSTAALTRALDSSRAADFGFDLVARDAARSLLDRGAFEAERVTWQLRLGELPETLRREPEGTADVVFWDPFSPPANPELWTLSTFEILRRGCRPGASVHTYSGATRVRSALLLAGFSVGLGAPLSSDREATIATLAPGVVQRPLDRHWLERLRRSSAPFPPDAPKDALQRLGAHYQFR